MWWGGGGGEGRRKLKRKWWFFFTLPHHLSDHLTPPLAPAPPPPPPIPTFDFDFSALQYCCTHVFHSQLTSARFSSVARPTEERALPALLKYPAFFELAGDTIERVYVVDADPIFSTNIKKGIMALFQLKQEPGERSEASGIDARTIYLCI